MKKYKKELKDKNKFIYIFIFGIISSIFFIYLISGWAFPPTSSITNQTDGFHYLASTTQIRGMWNNVTDLWFIKNNGVKTLNHTNHDGSVIYNDGVILADILGVSLNPTGACGNSTDAYIVNYGVGAAGGISHIKYIGGTWVNQSDSRDFPSGLIRNYIGCIGGDGETSGAITGFALLGAGKLNITDFNFNVISGFDWGTTVASTQYSVRTNGTDLWSYGDSSNAFSHSTIAGVNQSDAVNATGWGVATVYAFTINEFGFYVAEDADQHFYHLGIPWAYVPPDNAPEVSLDVPLNNTVTLSNNILFNCSATDDYIIKNISLFINGIRNYTFTDGINSYTNLTIYRNIPFGSNYQWTCESVDNSTIVNIVFAANRTFNISKFIENHFTFNQTSYETGYETFILNISSTSGTVNNVKLNYNGTNYTATSTISGDGYIFSTPISIPLITSIGNKSFNYFWDLDGELEQSSIYSHLVNQTIFGLCNSTLSKKYLNVSFKDEATNNFINATIPSSTWKYWIGDGSINKSYLFTNNTQNQEYDFCFTPYDKKVNVKTDLQYEWVDYPQRLYQNTFSLSNLTTNKTLYLLSSTDGIYVTFQVQNANTEQVISGVDVIGTRSIGGEEIIVAIGTTDSAGSVTFWLNPDFLHTFNFSKAGYETFTTSIFPTQSSYTISMTTGETTTSSYDYTKGIYYIIKPSNNYLINNTDFNFNFTLNSTYWNVERFGFGIYYNNGSLVNSVSSTSNGGIISLDANTLNSSTIRMNFYYIINSTAYNGTRTWYVNSGGTEFSIFRFFNDLTLYLSNGIFGIDEFGRIIICIVIILIIIGSIISKYGVQNEAVIMGMLFSIVFFFDIGIGLIPSLTFGGNSIPHFITIALGLLLIGFLIKEESR